MPDNSLSGTNFIAGCIGSTTATTVVYPLDVLRTRLVGQGEPKVHDDVLLSCSAYM